MNILLDVHISNAIASALRQAGHNVQRVAEIDREMDDDRILALAITHGCVLITEDSDFPELIFARDVAPPPALVYVRCRPFDQLRILEPLIAVMSDARLPGHVAVVTPDSIRFRSFPKVHKI